MAYIHEKPEWPDFTWDSAILAGPLAALRHKQGRHLGKMEALGFDLRAEASLTAITEEIVRSSAIEGERLDPAEIRSSLARRLGLDIAGLPRPSREVEGVVEMMLDATQNFAEPLSKERLCAWHAALFPSGRSGMKKIIVGSWRGGESGPMQVVSGPYGRERVHFEAPSADRLDMEIDHFLEWVNGHSTLDPILKAGVAHIWIVTIHPFEDGNGRIARAITELLIARADGTKDRFYSMSSGIEKEREAYYQELERAQRGGLDITSWLTWFLSCLERAIEDADGSLAAILRKARLWQKINLRPVNDRQRKVINHMLEAFEGKLSTSKYAKLVKCSNDTALRDIGDLLERGILVKNPAGGRSTSYRLADPD